MSIVEKENESGIKFNERLFVVLHGQFFGYISQVKMNEDPMNIDVQTAKVKIPIKDLAQVETDHDIIQIKFTQKIEGKLFPKEWILRVASAKMANFWKELLQYEIQLRKESERKRSQEKRTSSEKKDPPSLSQLRQNSGFGKNVAHSQLKQPTPKEETFNELYDSAESEPKKEFNEEPPPQPSRLNIKKVES